VLSEEDEHRYVAALKRNGFFGPDSWYMNWRANLDYAQRAKANWRIAVPVQCGAGEVGSFAVSGAVGALELG
jgi:hypothetical protein